MKRAFPSIGTASLALLVAGCVSAEEPGGPEIPPPLPPASAFCDAEAASGVIGELARVDVVDRAKTLSGAETVRVIGPGQPVTQDYRQDRLNIETDAQNRIVNLRCG